MKPAKTKTGRGKRKKPQKWGFVVSAVDLKQKTPAHWPGSFGSSLAASFRQATYPAELF